MIANDITASKLVPLNSKTYNFLAETMALASNELSKHRGEALKVSVKPDSSIVTEADLASEKVIIDRIRRHYPDDHIYSEEAGRSSQLRTSGSYIWIIDPLDGTTNYANGYPYYCISIGRGQFGPDGKIQMLHGSVFDAVRQRHYYAGLGEGAYVDDKRIHVAPPRELKQSFLVTGFYYMQGKDLRREIERFARIAEQCQSVRRDGAAALDLALVAEGVFDAFWEMGLQPWDVAAGSLLVSEAGGHNRNYGVKPDQSYDLEAAGIISGSPGVVASIASQI